MNPLPCILVTLACLALSIARAAEFPAVRNSEAGLPPTPEEALAKLQFPPGFKATLFAAEPDVQNPIAMAWDARGRLWIAENFTYAERAQKFDLRMRDRVLIFDDKDNDGRFDERKVFTDDVQMLTSVEVGRGGVWLMCPPQLLFIVDKERDDVPDGPAEVVLDGFTVPADNYHNFANGLRWGPDGWLYGRCGASAPGLVGKPGTPAAERIPIHGGIWRYDVRRKVFEVLTHGTTNPWGHDWDEHGEGFFINTVNGHLWHLIPGAHLDRPHTKDPNPRAYALLDQHADHWHFDTGQGWTASRDGKANSLGGGHAHVGMMIYHGENWPAEYRGKLFTVNMHGRRVNVERLERRGSGYVGKHEPDMILSGDPWFRGMELSTGPDGGVFLLDWSDTGECHDSTGVHRTSGRIFKITHGEAKPTRAADLTKLTPRELVTVLGEPSEWHARQAQVRLAELAASGDAFADAQAAIEAMAVRERSAARRLRGMWTLHAAAQPADRAPRELLSWQLHHADEHVRTWAVRLLTNELPLDTVAGTRPAKEATTADAPLLDELRGLATKDPSGLVRLALASTLQRLPISERLALAAPLLVRAEDANDHNLPLLIWYGLAPVADKDPAALVKLAAICELPATRKFIARRLAEDIEKRPEHINELLRLTAEKPSEAFQTDILAGVAEALTGWRKAAKPAAWDALQAKLASTNDKALRDRVRDLSALFGDGRALDEVKRVALNSKADLNARRAALQTIIDHRPPDLREICEGLLNVGFLNLVAVRGLAGFDDPALGEKLAKSYGSFYPAERPAVIDTLVARPAFARALLQQMAAGKIGRADLTPFHARQVRSFNDPALTQQLTSAWGDLRDSTDDKRALIANFKTQLTPEALARADKRRGRAAFNTLCATCHTLFGHGAQIGPDLTGSGRDHLDYVLEHVIDPSAVVTADFRMSVVQLKDGRVLTGVITAKTERTITLRGLTDAQTLERAEVKEISDSPQSLMPEGLLGALSDEEVRDFVAYLMSPTQVPLPDAR